MVDGLPQLRKPTGITTLADSVYDSLLEAILAHDLPPGIELSVVALAKALGVSRTPVHEALRHLARDGLVIQQVNRTARVAVFTPDDIADIFEMRILLEGASAYRAVNRISADDLARLEATAQRLAREVGAMGWLDEWIAFDDDFHTTIAKASGSPRLAADIGRYRLLHRAFNRLATARADLSRALAEHQAILEALRQAQADLARERMQAHIRYWQGFFVSHFPTPPSVTAQPAGATTAPGS